MSDLILLDSLVFVIGCLAGFVFLAMRTRRSPALFALAMLYLIGTYSSYNIMVKPIHDFNQVIARNAFFHLELVGPFAPIDFVGFPLVALVAVRTRRIPLLSAFLRPVLVKDLILAGLSLAAYLSIRGHAVTSFAAEVSWYRGLIYLPLLFMLGGLYLRKRERPYDFRHVFFTFFWADVINFVSGFVASLIYRPYVWTRYGFDISIIDQDDATNIALVYFLLFLASVPFGPNLSKSFAYRVTLTGIAALTTLNFYKTNFALGAIFLVFLLGVAVAWNRQVLLRAIVLLTLFPAALVGIGSFVAFGNTTALDTRVVQFRDFWHFAADKGPIHLAIGIGSGTYFDRADNPADAGEIKAIDLQQRPGLARSIQTPLLTVVKFGGILGLLLHIAAVGISIWLLFRRLLFFHPFSIAGVFYLMYKLLQEPLFLSPAPFDTFTIAKVYLLLVILAEGQRYRGTPPAHSLPHSATVLPTGS